MRKEERISEMRELLVRAKKAHYTYEKKVLKGKHDEDWPDWYADYLIGHGLDNIVGDKLEAEMLSRFLLQTALEKLSQPNRLTWAEFTARKFVTALKSSF